MKSENFETIHSDPEPSDGNSLQASTLTRRQFLALAASASAGLALASCAPTIAPTPIPPMPTALPPTAVPITLGPPETTTIRLTCSPCDSAVMAAERYLREEGFTTIEITDMAAAAALTSGKADIVNFFPPTFANAVEVGMKVVGLTGLHPGCAEIWAQQSIASIKDLRGKTIVITSKTLATLGYSYMVVVLKQAGIDVKDVNFVVQADADPVKLYLEGKNDAVFVATTAAAALNANSANKGHMIHSQIMDEPWAHLDCCILATTQDWYRANPIATKRALRAIYRSADALPADRADAVKLATDKGLFGGANNFANVRTASNMVPLAWRDSDPEKSVRFFAPLLADTGLSKLSADDLAKAFDLRILGELRTEMKKTS